MVWESEIELLTLIERKSERKREWETDNKRE